MSEGLIVVISLTIVIYKGLFAVICLLNWKCWKGTVLR